MTIKYPNGTTVEALLLSRGDYSLRAAVPGEDDARTFTLISGTWISEDCDPVRIEFAWERHDQANASAEADCICSKQLASRLISMLLVDSSEDNLIEDMLWVFSPDGQRVRISQSQLHMDSTMPLGRA